MEWKIKVSAAQWLSWVGGNCSCPKPQGQPHHQGQWAVSSQEDAWWWWHLPEAGAACKDGVSLLLFFREQTIRAKIWFPSVRCSDIVPEHSIPLLYFFSPLEITGKRHLSPAHYRSPCAMGARTAGVSKWALHSRGWCICCDPPGTYKALCFSKHGSNPFLPKCNQVPDLRGRFSTASPSARQPALLSGRPGRQDLMCCLVIRPAEDVQCHKLIIWLHAVHIGVTMWKS